MRIFQDHTFYPIECKKTAAPSKTDSQNFSKQEKFNLPIGLGSVVCLTRHILPISKDVNAVPVGVI
jgi:hypothetical protein